MGPRRPRPQPARPSTSRERCSTWPREVAALPAPPRHPLGRHGDLRPARGRGVPGRVGAHGGPHRPAVGQGRLRGGRSGEVRPARPRHARARSTTRSTSCASTTASTSTWPRIPQEDAVYDMLCEADSVGVFQVESRAQMATLPRLRAAPLLRPGRRGRARSGPGRSRAARCTPTSVGATGRSRSRTCTRCWRTSLKKTLGVPLFQEQLMQMAIDVAGFTRGRRRPAAPGHGIEARPASAWSSCARRFFDGMARNGITGEIADEIYDKLAAFANFGFPESHSVSLRLPRVLVVAGSSTTTRRRSAPRCSTRSRWASGRR